MSGIYYALSILAVFIVIQWFIRNDKKTQAENTTGLLAMRGLESQPKSSSQSVTTKSPTSSPNKTPIPNKT
jgi:hypothetical protein